MINAQNASRLFCREAFFDHMDYYRRARNRRKWGLIRGHESNGIRAETIKTVRNVRKKFSVPVWDHEAAGSKPVTRTMQSVLIGSENPVMDALLFYFPKNSYCNLFRGVP